MTTLEILATITCTGLGWAYGIRLAKFGVVAGFVDLVTVHIGDPASEPEQATGDLGGYRKEAPVPPLKKLRDRPMEATVVPSTPETSDRDLRVELSWVKKGIEYKSYYEGCDLCMRSAETGIVAGGDLHRLLSSAVWNHKRNLRASKSRSLHT